MTSRSLEGVAKSLVADGKGILAADETVPTLTKRFDTLGMVGRISIARGFAIPLHSYAAVVVFFAPCEVRFQSSFNKNK